MTLYYHNNGFLLYHADVIKGLIALKDKSVQCIVTSPPYWGLRDYGIEGQIGLESDPDEFIDKMVQIFLEASRILKDDGTLWLNLGDTYSLNGGGYKLTGKNKTNTGSAGNSYRTPGKIGLKRKELVGIPWRVAFALQESGWYLRQDIIWSKPSPMPESVRDRCTKSHEYIFLFTKKPKYYFNNEAIKEPAICGDSGSSSDVGKTGQNKNKNWNKTPSGWDTSMGSHREKLGRYSKKRPSAPKGSFNGKTETLAKSGQNAFRAVTDTKNKRSVWTIASIPFPEAHFATFPPELPNICIKAGTRENDIVLDPFNGAGTTGLVARELGRKYIGIDINAEYLDMTIKRVEASLNQLTAFDLIG